MSDTTTSSLAWALRRLAQTQSASLDALRLQASLDALALQQSAREQLVRVCAGLGLAAPCWLAQPDLAHLPLLTHLSPCGWGVVVAGQPNGAWLVYTESGPVSASTQELVQCTVIVQLKAPRRVGVLPWLSKTPHAQGFMRHVHEALHLFRGDIAEACLATVFMGLLALATSLFSMQVYDRVIPTHSEYTLIILASGVLLTIGMELVMKLARSQLMQHVTVGIDNRLSREIFSRLLQLRLDQVPASVGSLAGQVRGYEQVRSFYTSTALFVLVDLPLGLLFLVLLIWLGSPLVAGVPLLFGGLALAVGVSMRNKITGYAKQGAHTSNLKTGLLVETVEGMETIKSGWGGWKFLSRWVNVNREVIDNDMRLRAANEHITYFAVTLQQISYATLVAVGAWGVIQGGMTMGGLIACSIISGRILAPVMAIPGLLVQHAQTQAALEGLEKLYERHIDNEDASQVLIPETLRGHYLLTDVSFAYGDNPPSFKTSRLEIVPGEHIVVVGPIGAGKSTLLRLLSGMYQPTKGRILMDGLELAQIHRQVVSQHVGYLQQDHRLFQGTLRENLLIGMPDPGDKALFDAMRRTGMDKLVTAHPKGLERPIMEGGQGLSGGQKQLLAFTRLVLMDPDVWLLDEPTATMDEAQEQCCLGVLSQEAAKGKTLIVVTHKSSLMARAMR
jgi:ATP-binding cassette, subfamily C, bacterial LapB